MVPQTQVTWFVKVGLLIGACLLVGGLLRSCVTPAPLPDPTQAIRDSAQRAHAADSVRWATQREALTGTVQRLEAQRDSLKAARRPVRVVFVPTLDTLAPGAKPDSVPYVPQSDYLALAHELSIADTVIATQAAIIRADSAAYARLGAIRAFEDSTHKAAYNKLARDLAKARRGCRVLGLLPCPSVTIGYGATVAAGTIHVGPQVGVAIPVRF